MALLDSDSGQQNRGGAHARAATEHDAQHRRAGTLESDPGSAPGGEGWQCSGGGCLGRLARLDGGATQGLRNGEPTPHPPSHAPIFLSSLRPFDAGSRGVDWIGGAMTVTA